MSKKQHLNMWIYSSETILKYVFLIKGGKQQTS